MAPMSPPTEQDELKIIIISDGTGETASLMTKAAVANVAFPYEIKNGLKCSVPFHGRLVTCANDDLKSLSMIPDRGISACDKFIVLRTDQYEPDVTFDEGVERRFAQQLPAFVRWLLDLDPSDFKDFVILDSRFGIVATQDEELMQEAEPMHH